MTTVLQQCPILQDTQVVEFHGTLDQTCRIEFKRYQMFVWLSVSPIGRSPAGPIFPAVLDTGCATALLIKEEHLKDWGNCHPYLELQRSHTPHALVNGQFPAARFQAQVWLHPNLQGTTDCDRGRPPFKLSPPHGILITPVPKTQSDTATYPRVPLLGWQAFVTQAFKLTLRPTEFSLDLEAA